MKQAICELSRNYDVRRELEKQNVFISSSHQHDNIMLVNIGTRTF
jgi:hypothetical protein